MSEIARTASFLGGYALPGQDTNLRVGPGIYTLSSRGNLPFLEFSGAGFAKTISWGEFVEIPCAQLVTVKNVSAHPGNIFVNKGCDDHNTLPSRITVPVPILSAGVEFGDAATKYRFDTRRAKRAYLVLEGIGPFDVTVVGITGVSHETQNQVIPPYVGSGYMQTHLIHTGVQCPPIPLGFKAVMGDDSRPHTLLDAAYVAFNAPFLGTPPTAYYVAEYL